MEPQRPEDLFDPLAHLLDEARWPAPPPESIERLRRQWRSLAAGQARRGRRATRVAALLVAASVLVAAIIYWGVARRLPDGPPTQHLATPSPSPSGGDPAPEPKPAGPPKSEPGLVAASKQVDTAKEAAQGPPTPYEQVLIVAARRQMSGKPTSVAFSAKAASSWPSAPHKDAAFAERKATLQSVRAFLQRVADPRTSAAALASADLDCLPVETLLEFLASSERGERMAAAMVLGRLNRPEVSRRLIEMTLRGVYRQEALLALLSSSETSAQEFLAGAERNPTLWAALWNAKHLFETLSPWRS